MPGSAHRCYQLSHHQLAILDPERSLLFYQDILGMTLVATQEQRGVTRYLLGYACANPDNNGIPTHPHCLLELVFDPARHSIANRATDLQTPGYWKIALSVGDLELARQSLLRHGVDVTDAFQVPDVAYLCHFEDPDGYCIELIQHRMQHNHRAQQADPCFALNTMTSFALITVRVKNPQRSIDFYAQLGLRLISRQQVNPRGFTLYFLSADSEAPPSDDIDNIEMREWLWQRPYALLELQHVWGNEASADFCYRTDAATGFDGIRLLVAEFDGMTGDKPDSDAGLACETRELVDPDGYRVQLMRVNPKGSS